MLSKYIISCSVGAVVGVTIGLVGVHAFLPSQKPVSAFDKAVQCMQEAEANQRSAGGHAALSERGLMCKRVVLDAQRRALAGV